MKPYQITCFVFLLCIYTPLFSNQNIIDKALFLKLDQNQYWLKLLHFENKKSIINNKDFFLSPFGQKDPKKELIATIQNIFKDPTTQCKYPARIKWLQEKLSFVPIEKIKCPKLDLFLTKNYSKMSIIFTSERYDSPSSIFGHTFIKVETDSIPYAINFAATVPENQNQFLYAYRGITGKYPSEYKILPFSGKDYEYRAKEFRDLIEFEIQYSRNEINNVMLHLYEIQHTQQNYYFIGRNCSSEILKLLDMAQYTSTFSKKLSTATIPIDIIYILENENLISNISTQLSKLKLFYIYEKKLNNYAKDILQKIIQHKQSIHEFDKDTTLSFNSKKNIILASITYIEMIAYTKKFESKYTYSLLKLIHLSNKYNLTRDFNLTKKLKKNPISNKFHKLSFGTEYLKHKESFSLQYRYLYRNRFDLMDDIKKNGTVEFFDLKIKSQHDTIILDELILLNLEAMPLSNQFFTNTTNKISIGAKRLFYTDHLYNFIEYGLGYKSQLNNAINYHFFGNTGAYYFNKDIYKVSIESSLEYIYNSTFISELKLEHNTFSNGLETHTLYSNNYLKMTNSTVLNFTLEYKKDIKEYTNVILNYTFMF